jgi:hypothetical protein
MGGFEHAASVRPLRSSCGCAADLYVSAPAGVLRHRASRSISNRPPHAVGADHPSCPSPCDLACRAPGATPRTHPAHRRQCSDAGWSLRTHSSRLVRDRACYSLSPCPSPHLCRDELILQSIIPETPASRNTLFVAEPLESRCSRRRGSAAMMSGCFRTAKVHRRACTLAKTAKLARRRITAMQTITPQCRRIRTRRKKFTRSVFRDTSMHRCRLGRANP